MKIKEIFNNFLKRMKENLKFENLSKSSFFATFVAIILGLLISLIFLLFIDPSQAFSGFSFLLFGGLSDIGDVIYFATPIILTGLSVGFAFKMGLFNIGASGQYTMGLFFGIFVIFMVDIPNDFLHIVTAIIAGILGGFIWGIIPGILKAEFNVNEVITSIMLNYTGVFVVDYFIVNNSTMFDTGRSVTKYIPQDLQLSSLGFTGSRANIGFIIAIICAIGLYVILKYTVFGYELKSTGFNKDASKYAGMNYKRNTILTMGISGALAGLAGILVMLAPSNIIGSSTIYEPTHVIAAVGFSGIAVALLANSNPLGIIASALFISYLGRGGDQISRVGFVPEIVDVSVAIIIYFAAFALLMNHALAEYLKKRKEIKELQINAKDGEK
ncbi:ABC transporter permease [Mycoplasmatota bacterium]|nr:ABC transporter permease [Mycoplasmatota bacterium]